MSCDLSDMVEIYTHCDECGEDDSFTSDHSELEVGDEWEQECTNHPECEARTQTITRVLSYGPCKMCGRDECRLTCSYCGECIQVGPKCNGQTCPAEED